VAWMLLGTAAARDADARGQEGRWVGVAWVLCFPLGVALWLNAADSPDKTSLAEGREDGRPRR